MQRIYYPPQTVLIPVLTNAIYFIPCFLLYKRKYLLESFDLLLLILFSSFHHLCNSERTLDYCIIDNPLNGNRLSLFDDLYAIYAIMNGFILFYRLIYHLKVRIVLIGSCFMLYLFTNASVAGIYSVVSNIVIIFTLKYYCPDYINTFKIKVMIYSLVFFSSALYLKLNDSTVKDINGETNLYHFALYHSFWHILSGLSLSLLIISVSVPIIIISSNTIQI